MLCPRRNVSAVLHFIALPQNQPFAVALALMLGLLVLQLAGLGGDGGHDADTDADADGPLAWLGAGRVPLMVVLVILLTAFGLLGLKAQAVAQMVRGAPLSAFLVAPAAFLLALPITRFAARLVGRLLPSVETAALPRDALVGRRASITVGRAAAGSPAQARVRDPLGGIHHVMVEPEASEGALAEGAEILLTRREGETFRAIRVDPNPFLTTGAR